LSRKTMRAKSNRCTSRLATRCTSRQQTKVSPTKRNTTLKATWTLFWLSLKVRASKPVWRRLSPTTSWAWSRTKWRNSTTRLITARKVWNCGKICQAVCNMNTRTQSWTFVTKSPLWTKVARNQRKLSTSCNKRMPTTNWRILTLIMRRGPNLSARNGWKVRERLWKLILRRHTFTTRKCTAS